MKITIYMKSGNRISLWGVKDYNMHTRGDSVILLELHYRWYARKRLLISTIALGQIEAVVKG